jgi:ABC-2 type transport system ATP-binding protein
MPEITLKIRGLKKHFAQFDLGPVDMNVPTGAIYGLIGANGAGKTTTIDLIMGMGNHDAGTIEVFGLDNRKEEVAIKKRTGYVSPDLDFKAWKTVGNLLNFVRGFYEDWDDAYCVSLLGRLHLGWGEKIATLSFGARTKLSLVAALSHRPALLLLDEPLTGLDAVSKSEVFAELLDAVQDEQRTVLISSHNLDDIERFTDHLGIIDKGKMLLEGPTAGLIERFRMVHCNGPLGVTPRKTEGLYPQRADGNRWRVLVDQTADGIERLKSGGFTDLSDAPVTLEELFVGLVKERVV